MFICTCTIIDYNIHSFMALPSVQDRSEDGNESVSLERSETYPSDKLVLMLVPETSLNLNHTIITNIIVLLYNR